MIDWIKTKEKFGYDKDAIKSSSKVVVKCPECGCYRNVQYQNIKSEPDKVCRSCSYKKVWENPYYKQKMSCIHKKRYENPKERQKTGESTSRGKQKLWSNPEYAKVLGKSISDRTIERYKDPKARETASDAAIKRYEDPLEHIKTSASQQGISVEEWEDFAYNKPNHYGVSDNDYDLWRHKVYERDNHTCQICGNHHCMIHAHHIKKQFLYPELILEITNGITMCKTCHESTYGKEELFVEELQMIVNKTI